MNIEKRIIDQAAKSFGISKEDLALFFSEAEDRGTARKHT